MNDIEFNKYLEELGIMMDDKKSQQLEVFYKSLIDFNNKINITSITQKQDVYLKHFYDSLTLTKAFDFKKNVNVCDFGTGAGFPGLILKIFYPNIKLTLIESVNKKTMFLKEIISKLDLKNVEVITGRVEDYSKINIEKYDLVTCRAVSKLSIISELCASLVKINGYFIPMKSDIKEEIKNNAFLEKLNMKIVEIYEFNLPLENSKRSLIKMKKIKSTEKKYPRSYKMIKEKPL